MRLGTGDMSVSVDNSLFCVKPSIMSTPRELLLPRQIHRSALSHQRRLPVCKAQLLCSFAQALDFLRNRANCCWQLFLLEQFWSTLAFQLIQNKHVMRNLLPGCALLPSSCAPPTTSSWQSSQVPSKQKSLQANVTTS